MLFILLTILHPLWFTPQALVGWELLSSVKIVMGYDPYMGTEIEQPEFSEQLVLRDGQSFSLEGFIIPIQEGVNQDYFVLSRFPYQSCFFCGAAGPETVVEVYSDQKFEYTDDRVRVTGILNLNNDNPLRLFFILKKCEVIKIE